MAGVLSSPRVLTVDNCEVFVADCNNNRIAIFNPDLEVCKRIREGKTEISLRCEDKLG